MAERYDEKWRQRERVLNTLLILLFIYRLVLSPRTSHRLPSGQPASRHQ